LEQKLEVLKGREKGFGMGQRLWEQKLEILKGLEKGLEKGLLLGQTLVIAKGPAMGEQ